MLKTCLYCGDTYEAVRSTRKFCSNACKSDYHKLNKMIENDGDSGIEMLRRLTGKARKFPDKRPDVLLQVKRIEAIASQLRGKLET